MGIGLVVARVEAVDPGRFDSLADPPVDLGPLLVAGSGPADLSPALGVEPLWRGCGGLWSQAALCPVYLLEPRQFQRLGFDADLVAVSCRQDLIELPAAEH